MQRSFYLFLIICLSFVSGIICAFAYVRLNESNNTSTEAVVLSAITPTEPRIITIGWVGDIIPGDIEDRADGFTVFGDTLPYLSRNDLMIGNFEGALTESENDKCRYMKEGCFAFKSDERFAKMLSDAGFDVLNLANNHGLDFGVEGRNDTVTALKEYGIEPLGVPSGSSVVVKVEGIRVGIIGMGTYRYENNISNLESVRESVDEISDESDVVIFVMHGGGEGSKFDHVLGETEWYMGEDRGNVQEVAHTAVDAGADLVLGTGPHVLRGIESYKGKIIAYSLGNFGSVGGILTSGKLGISGILEITLRDDGEATNVSFISTKLTPGGSVFSDTTDEGKNLVNNLSKTDFDKDAVIVE